MGKVIGIDLGSTLSECAIIEGGKATVVANEDGSYTTPSVVSIIDGERKVGAAAKRQQIVKPKNTVYLIKRFMGSTYAESADAIKHVQYDVVNEGGKPRVKIDDRTFSPEEISSYILGKMKKVAEDYLGQEVKDAVITVPAFFGNAAKEATKMAGELAGLNVLRIIAEPTAAILSSNIDMKKGGKYMVVDFGGSTLDNSVADISDGVVEILSTNGDVYLGGSDIDKCVADYVVSEFRKTCSTDISKDAQAMTRVLEAVEKAKIELSNSSSTDINIPYITVVDNVPQHLTMTLTRAKFEQLIEPIVNKLIGCAKKAVELAKISSKDLDGILLIGGSCRIPAVQEEGQNQSGNPSGQQGEPNSGEPNSGEQNSGEPNSGEGKSGEGKGKTEPQGGGGLSADIARLIREQSSKADPAALSKILENQGWFRIKGAAKDGLGDRNLKDVPAEYRDLVRAYFLKLSEEK